ncbi:hypothetical protein LJR038_003256 [Acidovorax sp. LjRoot38]|uniref:hypothetical protein n=1 Tax=Acidovorax sp. LjRoot38 TaxID=3342327 RepID=UPI003ECC6668
MKYAIALIAVSACLLGCETAPRVEIQRVNVAVPIECKEPIPERPVMPTEALRPGATVDQFTQVAQAEIERREGYEVQLRAALAVCTAPVGTGPAKEPLGLRAAWPK